MTQKVTKAIIAAAGLGSRMFPFTKVESKLLIPVGNKPMIELLLEELTASGIKEVVIVSNHIHNLKQLFKDDKRLNSLLHRMKKDKLIDELHHVEYMADINFIDQEMPMGWMHEVFHAKEHLTDRPFLVCFSDVLYDSKIPAAKQIIDYFEQNNKNIKATARIILKPSIFKMKDMVKFKVGEDIADEELFEILKRKKDFLFFNIEGDIYDIGEPLEYLKTQTVFGLKDKEIGEDYHKFIESIVKK